MAAGGKGFVLFARAQTDTPGKLAAHAYSYEALEIGSYELLQRFADRARDRPCAATAALILADEVKMRGRIGDHWDEAVDASLEAAEGDDLEGHLVRYLADAHALESQSIELLERAPDMAGDERLARLYRAHLEETRGHRATIRERLDAHDEGPSLLKEAAMRLGGLNWAMFFEMQPDTPGKFAAFAYAFEHLEIGGYEQLLRVARRAGDHATVTAVQGILVDELATATAIADAWDLTADASLSAQGVA
jgi:ferritin-like metal-binding protein YciE